MTTVQKSIIFLVLYVAICVAIDSISTLPDLDCDTNGNVILRNDTDLAKIEIVNDDGTLCTPASAKSLTEGCKPKAKSPITILYGDHVQMRNGMVGGQGSQYAKVSCKDEKVLVFATAKSVIDGTPPSIPVKEIDMKYPIKLSIDGLSISNGAKLGDKFTLILEGPDNTHLLRPHECKAFETRTKGNEYTIWQRKDDGTCANEEPSIIEQTWTTVPLPTGSSVITATQKTKLSIGMYAFRFAKSSTVTIECSAYVCPPGDKSSDCGKKCIDVPSKRRRRAVHGIQTSPKLNTTSTKIMVASTSFQVQLEDPNTGNSAGHLSKNVQLYSVASIFVLMVTMMI